MEKFLWFVNMPGATAAVTKAQTAGVDGVFVRTSNDNFHDSIPLFKDAGMKIYGWRFPSTVPSVAMNMADHVLDLYDLGLDGFVLDPEDHPSSALNWNHAGLESLAQQLCDKLTVPGKLLGVTSHFNPLAFPHLPFATFINNSQKVYPQAYWKVLEEGHVKRVLNGDPEENYLTALTQWKTVGADTETIFPMAGELAVITQTELEAYRDTAVANNVSELHFYAIGDDDEPVPNSKLTIVKNL